MCEIADEGVLGEFKGHCGQNGRTVTAAVVGPAPPGLTTGWQQGQLFCVRVFTRRGSGSFMGTGGEVRTLLLTGGVL